LTPVNNRSGKVASILFFVVLATGVGLRTYQHFFIGRPLWEDEAHLALNFIESGHLEMFMPLKNFQSAPILFLLGVETFSALFGFSEIVLRLFPFIVAILCYPLFYYFVRDMTGSRLTALTAFILLTCNLYVIQYTSELKPYIVELSAYILLGFLLFSKSNYVSARRDKLLIVSGCTVLFAANTSFVFLAIIALYRWYKRRQINKEQLPDKYAAQKKADIKLYKAWGIAFAAMVILNIIINPYADNMRHEWQRYFIPFNIFSSDFVQFMHAQSQDIFFNTVFLFPAKGVLSYLVPVLVVAGLIYMLRAKKYGWLIISVLPVLAHLFLSWVQLYPLFQRFVLYLAPAVIIWLSVSVTAIAEAVAGFTHKMIGWGIVLVFLFVALQPSAVQYPQAFRDIRPCLDQINKQPSDLKLYTGTPKTLYEYYYKTGYANNATREEVLWKSSVAEYFDTMKKREGSYMLLHSRYNYDGLKDIVDTLDSMGLVSDKFEYSDYRLYTIKPAE